MTPLLRFDAPRARWTWHGAYDQRAIPKAAGFFWDGPARVWATTDAGKAARLAEYADGEDRIKLLALVQKNAEAVAASSATDGPEGIEIPRPPGLEYLPFQRAGIAYASSRPSCLIGDEMGLGKTIQALGVVNVDTSIRRTLVICPASLRLNWAREAGKWLVRQAPVFVVDGGKEKDFPKNLASSSDFFLIMNYDVVHKHRAALAELGPLDLLIVDEAHALKNPKALRTKAILGALTRKDCNPIQARRRLFLTGTPIMNKPVELWPLLFSIDPKKWGGLMQYAEKYCNAHRKRIRGGRRVWDLSGASHLPELQEELRKTCMVRRLKAAVLPELPPKRRQVLAIEDPKISGLVLKELDLLNAKAHGQDEALESMRDRLEAVKAGLDETTDWGEACATYAAACRVAFDEIAKVGHEVAVAKVPHVLEHVLSLVTPDPEYKVVVFARHHDVIDGLVEGLRAASIATVKVDGRDDMDARQAAVDGFQTGPAQVFVGQIKAAGVGLTLTAAAHVVFAELDWVPANLSQAEDRCHRIGQSAFSVLVQHVVLAGSLDERMAERIVEKQDVADRALDGAEMGVVIPDLPSPKNSASSSERGVSSSFDALARRGAKMTAEERLGAHAAVRMLAGMCDGAFTQDGMGFNRLDARTGKALAALDGTCLTDRQAAYCERLAIKYSRQTGFEKKKEVEK